MRTISSFHHLSKGSVKFTHTILLVISEKLIISIYQRLMMFIFYITNQCSLFLCVCITYFPQYTYVNIYVYAQIWTDSFNTKWNNSFIVWYLCFLHQNYPSYLSIVQLIIEEYRDFNIISQFFKDDWTLFKMKCRLLRWCLISICLHQ